MLQSHHFCFPIGKCREYKPVATNLRTGKQEAWVLTPAYDNSHSAPDPVPIALWLLMVWGQGWRGKAAGDKHVFL